MRRYSTSLIIGEMQITTIMRYQLKPIRRAIVKSKTEKHVCWPRMWRNWNPSAYIKWEYRMVLPLWKDGQATVTALHKVKTQPPYKSSKPTPAFILRRLESRDSDTCTPMFRGRNN